MVAKPMLGDGLPVYEGDPPVTLGELIATCDDNSFVLGALAFSRGWNSDCPKRDLPVWRQIGPDLLWAVNRQSEANLARIGPTVTDYVWGLKWVQDKRLNRLQIELAVLDAFEQLVYGSCDPAYISALRVACRKETFLELRAEATALMAFSMGLADSEFRNQIYGTA